MKKLVNERPCAVCGQFYPADPEELEGTVRDLIESACPAPVTQRIMGIIAPHAGYMYSGLTAAHAYALLFGRKYSCVVIVSPSHREYFSGISIFPGSAYRTPLGSVEVNSDIRERLLRSSDVFFQSDAGHTEEHAVEVHLPFLQVVLGEFTFVPIVMGDQRRENCFALGEALGSLLKGEQILLVSSTDLSHYHPSTVANQLDAVAIDDVRAFDYEALMRDIELEHTEACGGGPTVAVMLALSRLGANTMTVLHHCNSGDITGDNTHVVGYLSAVAYE